MKANMKAVKEATPAHIMPAEEKAINQVLEAGQQFGYGNMMAWLATAWESRCPGVFTGKHPRGVSPYPLDWVKDS
jgi:hypothetical protein